MIRLDYTELDQLWSRAEPMVAKSESLTDAGQVICSALWDLLSPAAILVRCFITLELRFLPSGDRRFASDFAASQGKNDELQPQTPILSLMGTRGIEPDWNSRSTSRGHLAIPLLSPEFIRNIPMIARMLSEIGLVLETGNVKKSPLVTTGAGQLNGIFFVPDARTTVDDEGRYIIAARPFVERYGVRSVFGFGGNYLWRNSYLAVVIFTRESMDRSEAMKMLPFTSQVKIATTRFLRKGVIFKP